jgi:hypothetical protein
LILSINPIVIMIQPPKLTQLVSSYMHDYETSVEEWLKQSNNKQQHRLAAPSPNPPTYAQSQQKDQQEVTSSTSGQNQVVPEYDSDIADHPVHPALERHTTPVPNCEELFFADFDLPLTFDPSEIWVTLDEDALVVEGEHRQLCSNNANANHFYECHEYFRKVPLPAKVDHDQIRCTLHRDGHLFIEAPLLRNITEIDQNGMEIEQAVRNIPD